MPINADEQAAFHAWLDESWPLWKGHVGSVHYNELSRAFYAGFRSARSESVHRWNPVSDMPPVSARNGDKPYVLAVDTKGRMSVGYCWIASRGEVCWTFAKPIGEVTHWMPLPEAPNGR
jgi:hypothetical protein